MMSSRTWVILIAINKVRLTSLIDACNGGGKDDSNNDDGDDDDDDNDDVNDGDEEGDGVAQADNDGKGDCHNLPIESTNFSGAPTSRPGVKMRSKISSMLSTSF